MTRYDPHDAAVQLNNFLMVISGYAEQLRDKTRTDCAKVFDDVIEKENDNILDKRKTDSKTLWLNGITNEAARGAIIDKVETLFQKIREERNNLAAMTVPSNPQEATDVLKLYEMKLKGIIADTEAEIQAIKQLALGNKPIL